MKDQAGIRRLFIIKGLFGFNDRINGIGAGHGLRIGGARIRMTFILGGYKNAEHQEQVCYPYLLTHDLLSAC
ncbi:MAG: hypothetical protein IPI66_11050 [Chitinophagaceae bacterium]|nr:hypothetical protein [Chitinophagaceae bacterium]